MARVLLIDDDPDIVDSISLVLTAEGFKVATAATADEGMRAVDREKPDLIILDVMMEQPDDGFFVAQELRRKGLRTPIIILSSIGHVTGYKYGKDKDMAPVDEFIEKPIAPDVLLAKVKALLRK